MILHVTAAYFWGVVALAFAIGALAMKGANRSERRRDRDHLARALDLLDEAQTHALITGGTIMSAGIVGRMRRLVRDVREGVPS